jgi:hypothetical protein
MTSRISQLIAVLVLFANMGFAQSGIKLSGRVVDDENQVLPVARVQLITGGDTTMLHVGSDGDFSFLIAQSSRVQLITNHIGFDTDFREFHVSRDTTVSIMLHFSSIQLSGTVVTARSRALVRSMGTGAISLSGEKLSNMPSLMGTPDINKILQLMPGVQHAGDANGHLYVRGGDPGHIKTLYNNVPVYGSSHLVGIFPFYNVDHVDRVLFDKSGSQTPYGNRLGATVQCFSLDEKPNDFSIKGNVGLLASQITASTPLGHRAGLVLSGRQTYVDQIIAPLIQTNKIDDFGYSFTDANLTLMLRPNEKHRIDLNVFVTGDRFKVGDNHLSLNGSMKWGNQLGSVSWTYQFRPNVNIHSDIYVSRYANFLEIEQAGLDLQLESNLLDWGFNTGADFKLASIPFTTGIQYANYRVKPQDLSSETLPVPEESNITFTAQLASAYLHGKPKINEYFSLDAGLRLDLYDGNSQKIDLRLEPRISLNFSDDYKWSAYLSYARRSQQLHLITTSSVGFPTDFWLPATEGIPVELANVFSMGSSYKILPGLELTTGLFYSHMNNLVYYPFNVLQFGEMTSFSNDIYVGKGKARGAEFMLTKTGRLSGWLSYTLSKSDRQFDEIDNGQTFSTKFDRRHDLSVAIIYKIHERWQVGLIQVFTSGSRFTVPTSWYFINNNPVKEYGKHNNATMPSYIRTDISVDFHIKKTHRGENILNFSIFNLFAVKNPTYVTLDVSPSETGNVIKVHPRYRSLYTILPSVSWRFRF